jgi:hypothetical protein
MLALQNHRALLGLGHFDVSVCAWLVREAGVIPWHHYCASLVWTVLRSWGRPLVMGVFVAGCVGFVQAEALSLHRTPRPGPWNLGPVGI